MFQSRVIQMSNQDLKQILKNDPIATVTNVSRDEVIKIVSIGNVIVEDGDVYVVGHKHFVKQSNGEYEIRVYRE